jgi:hypothetical protein
MEDLISDEAYQSMRKRKAALKIKIRMLYSVKSSDSGSRFISCSSNVTY